MTEPASAAPPTLPGYTTGLVDRINVAIHFRRYFKLVARRWVLLFVATTVGLGLALYQVSRLPQLYQAQAELEVARKVEVSNPGGAVVLDPIDSFYPNQLRIMGSATLRARVLGLLGAATPPRLEPPDTQYAALRGQGSSFQLLVTSPDLTYARLFASNWAQAFLDYKQEQLAKLLESKKYTFEQDIFRQQKLLEQAHTTTEQYRRQHQIGSASDTYKAAQQQLEQLKSELGVVQTSKRLLEQTPKEALASGALAGSRPEPTARPSANPRNTGAADDSIDPLSKFTQDSLYVSLLSQLNDQVTLSNSLTATLKPKHPEMIRLGREIADLNQKIQFQLQIIEDKRLATIKSLGLKADGLQARIAELAKQVQELRGVQDEFERRRQEENRIEQAIAALKNTLQQIDLSTSDDGQFSVVGEVSTAPVDPHKSRLLARGVGVGFVLGLALIYFLNRLDDRLELAEDIEAELKEPVLGQIPLVDMRTVKQGGLLITNMQRHNMFAESIRGVRSAILLGPHQGRQRVLAITSAVPGDGKTTVTVNFAATLAIAGSRVLLVDADLRRGNVHGYFGLAREPGLAEVLREEVPWERAVVATPIKPLHFMASGQLPAHPGELLVSPAMQRWVAAARRQFDYVVFDCPPLTAIDDTYSILGVVDGLLFVVRSGQTSMRFAQTALAAARQRGANVVGIVLNGITADNPYYYYNYYYHAYYDRPAAPAEPAPPPAPAPTPAVVAPAPSPFAARSIASEARAMTGEALSLKDLEAEARAKAALFKARRSARQAAQPTPEAGKPADMPGREGG